MAARKKRKALNLPTLVIVESPSKARTIEKYLGKDYIVRASYGHIRDLDHGGKRGIGVDLENNFKPRYKILADKKDKIQTIIDAATQSKEVLIAADPDREGEAIAWHLAYCIESTGKPISRVLFHEITKKAIQKAIANPTSLNSDLYDAQQARRVLDRIVGFKVQPYLINKVGKDLSAGRVQSVAVRMVVVREREIEKFKPETYWDITAELAKNKTAQSFSTKYTKRITNEKNAKLIEDGLEKSKFVVSDVEKKQQKRNPYPPFITATLQQAAAAKYKFAASRTMKAAQSLYQNGHITYMRSDSIRSAPSAIKEACKWLDDNGYTRPTKPIFYANKDKSQDAHEAIRPTSVAMIPDNMYASNDEVKVYKIIWERFVASQMEPAIYDTVAVTVEATPPTSPKPVSSIYELKANGRTLIKEGWLAIAKDNNTKSDEDSVIIPALKKGDKLILVPPRVKATKKQTKPPPRFSEASLIKELKNKGIGRPSTYATIMDKIKDRNYVLSKKNVFHATEIGKKVVDGLSKYFKFMEYDYTASMESQLDKIAEGELDYVNMLNGFWGGFKKELKEAYEAGYTKAGIDCEKCNSPMILRHSQFGYFVACSSYPDCKNTKNAELDGDKIIIKDKREIIKGIKCPKCKGDMIRRDGKFGPFYACTKYPGCKGTAKIPFGKKCPKCNSELFLTVFGNDPKLGCMGYPLCRHSEDVPKGTKVNWVAPNKIQPTRKKAAHNKILKMSSKD